MKATIYINGVIGTDTTLTDVIRQYKSFENPSGLNVIIHSEGGNVTQGDAIFDFLQGLKKSHSVDTETDKAYSISAKIFSVGEVRTIEDKDRAVMLHFAWAEAKGNADKFEAVAEYLRELEGEFCSYYSNFLNVDAESVRALLDNETFLSGSEAVDLGFATEIKTATKAVALYEVKNSINLKSVKMSKSRKSKGLLHAIQAYLMNEANALKLQDSNGDEIDFPTVEDGESPIVGDVGTIDDEPVKDGVYIIPSMDDAKLTFEGGVIVKIEAAEEEAEEVDANAEEIKQISVWEIIVANTSFEIGEVLEYEYDSENYAVGAGEFFIPSLGKNVITDASGVIVAIKENSTVVDPEGETEVNAKLIKALVGKVERQVSAKYQKQINAQAKEVSRLKKMFSSKEFKASAQDLTSGTRKTKVNGLAQIYQNKKHKK